MPLPESGSRPRSWPPEAEMAEYLEHAPGTTEPRFGGERPGEMPAASVSTTERLSSTMEGAKETGRRLVDVSKRRIHQASESIQTGAQRGLDTILDTLEEGRVQGQRGLHVLRRELQEHPLAGLGIAFLIGVAAGKLIRRSLR